MQVTLQKNYLKRKAVTINTILETAEELYEFLTDQGYETTLSKCINDLETTDSRTYVVELKQLRKV